MTDQNSLVRQPQSIMMFLQNPPTAEWTEKDLELILSEAFLWKETFYNTIK